MNANKKVLFKNLKSLLILVLTSYIFVMQSFFPVYSTIPPSCANGTPVCPSGFAPACSNGTIGSVVCNSIFGLSCQTSLSIFPGAATCVSSNPTCVTCTQGIPTCGAGTRLVAQTCSQCAHCELIVCSPPSCATLPSGCTYINIPRDANGCQTGCGTLSCQCNPPPCAAPPPGCTYINIPRDVNGCQTGCGTLMCDNQNCGLVPIPISGYTGSLINPTARISEANGKIAVGTLRKQILENLISEIANNLPRTCSIVSGLNSLQNPNGANDINTARQALYNVNLYISDLTSIRDFWTSFLNYGSCLNSNIFFNIITRDITNLEGLLTALRLSTPFDSDPNQPGIQTPTFPNINTSDPNAVQNLLIQERARLVAFKNEIDCSLPFTNPCIGNGFRVIDSDLSDKTVTIRYSIIPISLPTFTGDTNVLNRINIINNRIAVANERIGNLRYLLSALIAGERLSCTVSGLNIPQNPNGANDANVVKEEIRKTILYLNDLNIAKQFYTTVSSKTICLDTNPNFNVYLRDVFNYESLLTAIHLGQSVDFVPGVNNSDPNAVFAALESARNSILAIINNPNSCTTSSSSGSSTCFCSQTELENLCPANSFSRTCSNYQVGCCPLVGLGACRLLTCTTSSSSSSSGGLTSQCGSATCRNGEVCVVIDPCRGRPGCNLPIAQFCALPNASPFCSNGQIRCNAGSPVCNNLSINIPTCGSSIGFANDLSGPGCTNPDRTTLSVNSAYCSTSALRTPDEDKLSCTTKKLCPSGKRFDSCREDRHNCKCVCSFDSRNDKGNPRCNKQNNAICSGSLTPTCSNPDNIASCYSKKLTCANKIDGSIDLSDTIECK